MPKYRPENVAAFEAAMRLLLTEYGDQFPWTDAALWAQIESRVLRDVARQFPDTKRDVLGRAVRSGVHRAIRQARYDYIDRIR